MYVRFQAWLNAKQIAEKGRELQPRRFSYSGDHPEIGRLGYLYEYVAEYGFLDTWQEIKAWSELTGNIVESWEATLLKKISTAYHNQLEEARNPMCPSPFQMQLTPEQLSKRPKSTMRQLAK